MPRMKEKVWRAFIIELMLLIMVVVSGLFLGVFFNSQKAIEAELHGKARAIFDNIVLTRSWNAHCGRRSRSKSSRWGQAKSCALRRASEWPVTGGARSPMAGSSASSTGRTRRSTGQKNRAAIAWNWANKVCSIARSCRRSPAYELTCFKVDSLKRPLKVVLPLFSRVARPPSSTPASRLPPL